MATIESFGFTREETLAAFSKVHETPYSVVCHVTITPLPGEVAAHRKAIGWITSRACAACDSSEGKVMTRCCCGHIMPLHDACRRIIMNRFTCPLHGDEDHCPLCAS